MAGPRGPRQARRPTHLYVGDSIARPYGFVGGDWPEPASFDLAIVTDDDRGTFDVGLLYLGQGSKHPPDREAGSFALDDERPPLEAAAPPDDVATPSWREPGANDVPPARGPFDAGEPPTGAPPEPKPPATPAALPSASNDSSNGQAP